MPEIIRVKKLNGHTTDVLLDVPPPYDGVANQASGAPIQVFVLFMSNQMGIRSAMIPNPQDPDRLIDATRLVTSAFDGTDFRGRGWQAQRWNGARPCITITTTFLSADVYCPVVVLARAGDSTGPTSDLRVSSIPTVERVLFLKL